MARKKNSLLITDDSALNIAALSYILQNDYHLFTAKDGPACIDTAREHAPDLILLDIVMPGISGFDVITELKSNSLTRNIPVVFITGMTNTADEERGFLLGAADYISKPFSPAVVKLRVRNQIQIVNQLRHIHNISITDELTGIGNRRYFYDQLEQEWQRALRNRTHLAFIMFDIDKFKPYNDTYGHLQGDRALKAVAASIKTCLTRAIDKAARWGGEEFAVILPETDPDGARIVAERIRAHIETLHVPLPDGTPTRITVSMGINCTIPGQNNEYPLKNFISDADKALYQAKSSGRNRACAVAV